jgi:transcriptional regulator with XRE-family HTH domain
MTTTASQVGLDGIRARRERIGVTRERLAAASEVSVSWLQLLEGGFDPVASPSRERVLRVLAALEGSPREQ